MFDGERKKMRVESRRSLITLEARLLRLSTFAEAKPLPLMRVLQQRVEVLANERSAISFASMTGTICRAVYWIYIGIK